MEKPAHGTAIRRDCARKRLSRHSPVNTGTIRPPASTNACVAKHLSLTRARSLNQAQDGPAFTSPSTTRKSKQRWILAFSPNVLKFFATAARLTSVTDSKTAPSPPAYATASTRPRSILRRLRPYWRLRKSEDRRRPDQNLKRRLEWPPNVSGNCDNAPVWHCLRCDVSLLIASLDSPTLELGGTLVVRLRASIISVETV